MKSSDVPNVEPSSLAPEEEFTIATDQEIMAADDIQQRYEFDLASAYEMRTATVPPFPFIRRLKCEYCNENLEDHAVIYPLRDKIHLMCLNCFEIAEDKALGE